jgi:hypothetical protein
MKKFVLHWKRCVRAGGEHSDNGDLRVWAAISKPNSSIGAPFEAKMAGNAHGC